MSLGSGMHDALGALAEAGIRLWVRLVGRKVNKANVSWLEGPMGSRGRIGPELYGQLAEREGLLVRTSPDAGLLSDFAALKGPDFDPARVRPEIRDFYEHTARYRLEAWSEASLLSKWVLWLLVTFVSRRMDQLNFPVSSLELAAGMRSEILELVDRPSGKKYYTGWLRTMVATGNVVYAGLYSTAHPDGYPNNCVKVSFPLPLGSSTVLLRPEAQPDGSFKLISAGSRFGEPGFYRIVELDGPTWKVKYIRTLYDIFHVYVDGEGTLRTDHLIRFLGLTILRLHYKITRIGA